MQIKNRQQMLAVVAIAAVALFAADALLISPLTNAWKSRAKRMVDLRRQVSDGALLLQRESGIRSRWQEIRRRTLPDNTSAAEQQFHKAIDAWALESRVSIAAKTPQWKHDAEDYMTVEYRVEASGNLPTVARFLHDIEKDPMALRLQGVEISSHDNSGQQLSLGLQLSGLILTPGEPKR